MAQMSLNRLRKPTRTEWIATLATLAAVLAYVLVLGMLDKRAARYFTELRDSDPASYLLQLRESRGFEAFLEEYTALRHLDTFQPQAPSFLVGRWSMRADILRLTPGQAPERCLNPATFDFGLFLTVETGGVALPVQYRIAGNEVEMRGPGDAIFPIRLVSYGAELDHIEFTPPGHDTPVNAYHCGR